MLTTLELGPFSCENFGYHIRAADFLGCIAVFYFFIYFSQLYLQSIVVEPRVVNFYLLITVQCSSSFFPKNVKILKNLSESPSGVQAWWRSWAKDFVQKSLNLYIYIISVSKSIYTCKWLILLNLFESF